MTTCEDDLIVTVTKHVDEDSLRAYFSKNQTNLVRFILAKFWGMRIHKLSIIHLNSSNNNEHVAVLNVAIRMNYA